MKLTISKALTLSAILLASAGIVHTVITAVRLSRDSAGSAPWTVALIAPGLIYAVITAAFLITAALLRRAAGRQQGR